MAERGFGSEFTELGYLGGVLTKLARRPPGAGLGDSLRFGSLATAGVDAFSPDRQRSRRRLLFGRLAAVFYVGSGLLGVVTLPLPAPGLNRAATALISVAAVFTGIAIWFAPW